ncbi:MAG: hypothetical protein ACOWWO_01740 [Peptococcaceae bacterium]
MQFNMFYCGGQLWNARPWLDLTKSDAGGSVIMEQKANILPIYVENIYCGAANILKQEMLSLGGEVAVHKYAVNCKEQYGDVLILGTYKEYKLLFRKLAAQHWKLKELGQELKMTINNILAISKDCPQLMAQDALTSVSIKFTPTGNLIHDLREIRLTDSREDKTIIQINGGGLNDLVLLQQYIYALQSKGCHVFLAGTKPAEELVVNFLRPNYFC